MTEEEKAQRLATWLAGPAGGDPPADLDDDVLSAVYILKPSHAPAPRVSIDDVLASVTEGPFASVGETTGELIQFPTPAREEVSASPTVKEAARPRRRSNMWAWSLVGATMAAAAALLLVVPIAGQLTRKDVTARETSEMVAPTMPAPASAPAPAGAPESGWASEPMKDGKAEEKPEFAAATGGEAPREERVPADGTTASGDATPTIAEAGGAEHLRRADGGDLDGAPVGGAAHSSAGGAGGVATGTTTADPGRYRPEPVVPMEPGAAADKGGKANEQGALDDRTSADAPALAAPAGEMAGPSRVAAPTPKTTPAPAQQPVAKAPAATVTAPPPPPQAAPPAPKPAANAAPASPAANTPAKSSARATQSTAKPSSQGAGTAAPVAAVETPAPDYYDDAENQAREKEQVAGRKMKSESNKKDANAEAKASDMEEDSLSDETLEEAPKSVTKSASDPHPRDYNPDWYRSRADVAGVYAAAASANTDGAVAAYASLLTNADATVVQDAAWRAATSQFRAGRYDAALTTISVGTRRSSANTAFRANLLALRGDVYAAQGKLSDANKAWAEAISLNNARSAAR